MPILSKRLLLVRVLRAAELSGGRSFVSNSRHPFQISVWNDDQAKSVRLFIWNLTPGGPPIVRSKTEYRIQLTGIGRAIAELSGIDTIVLGWSEDHGVFAAFEAQRHQRFGSSPSIQIDERYLLAAQQSGFSFRTRGNQENVVCFSPDQFLNYIFHLHSLHRVGERPGAIEETSVELLLESLEESQVDEPRREAVQTVRQWVRQRDFRGRILSAYLNRCAVCRIQMNLVEAAHIVPVSIRGSSDSTNNGVCLCALHHTAYDSGLLGIAPDYRVLVNQGKMSELRNANLSDGEEIILERHGSTIVVPDLVQDRPTKNNLARGLAVRGWDSLEWET